MKKILVTMVVVLAAVAITLPAFAFEVKYGGLFRLRYQASQNVVVPGPDVNDNQNYIDQRLRIFFTFIASENLQVVTGLEFDTLWGGQGDKVRYGHRDTINAELKHAYVDFMIPCTPLRVKAGLQPIAFMQGWVVDEDFTGINATAVFDPFTVTAGYISEVNGIRTAAVADRVPVTEWGQRVDDWYAGVQYAQGPFTAGLMGFYQYGHNAGLDFPQGLSYGEVADAPLGTSDNLFDLGVNLGYKMDWMNAYINYVQNLGSYDDAAGDSQDYTGFMVEAGANMFYGPFTFSLGGFVTKGDSDTKYMTAADARGLYNGFAYPQGRSHYWSEILGLGTLDNSTGFPGTGDRANENVKGAWQADDGPSNIWTITAGGAWQALETTKLTFNYYYLKTYSPVYSNLRFLSNGNIIRSTSTDLGHEFDFYVDQKVVDGLMLRIVGAYMIANDAYTIFDDDPDPWEVGARLQWAF